MDDVELFLKNVVRRWTREIRDSARLIILSPYITSSTADTVTAQATPNTTEIYTLFSAELFLNQSSSVNTLRKLKTRGFNLFALENLHAKIVLVPDQFVSIGSQNLTLRGTKNREGTVAFSDSQLVDQVFSELAPWLAEATEITDEMLTTMESGVKPHLDLYQTLLEIAGRIDEEVANEAEVHRQRLFRLQEAVAKARNAKDVVFASVDFVGDNYECSLVVRHRESTFTRWKVGEDIVSLGRLYWYLVLLRDSGKVAWARVADTRISYYTRKFRRNGTSFFDTQFKRINFEGLDADVHKKGQNLKITFTLTDFGQIEQKLWFGLDELVIDACSTIRESPEAQGFVQRIEDDRQSFETALLKELCRPFRLNGTLSTDRADSVVGRSWSHHFVRAVMYDTHPILVIQLSEK